MADFTRPPLSACAEIPPCAGSLSNYRCEPGVSERLPDLGAPSPVNRTLPMTLHCVPCFDGLMTMSCEVKSDKCQIFEGNGVVQWVCPGFLSIFTEENGIVEVDSSEISLSVAAVVTLWNQGFWLF